MALCVQIEIKFRSVHSQKNTVYERDISLTRLPLPLWECATQNSNPLTERFGS